MKSIKISVFAVNMFLGLVVVPGCDDIDSPASALQEADVEEDIQSEQDEEAVQNEPDEEFDLAADMTPAAGPAGKCCKALCTWKPNAWQQLPPPYTTADNCNANADYFCGFQHLIDAQWRTCG